MLFNGISTAQVIKRVSLTQVMREEKFEEKRMRGLLSLCQRCGKSRREPESKLCEPCLREWGWLITNHRYKRYIVNIERMMELAERVA